MATKTLIERTFNWGGLLTVSEVQSFSSWRGALWHAGRHGAGGVAESPSSCRQQEVDCDTGSHPEHRKPQGPPPQ